MKRSYLVPALFVSLAMIAVACGDDSDDNPTPPDVGTAGTKATAGTGGKGNGTAGSKANDGGAPGPEGGTGGTAPSDGGEPPVETGGQGGTGPVVECDLPETGENGCFNCPKEPVEFLNRCSSSDCVPFDNAARLPKLNPDGSLPSLPN